MEPGGSDSALCNCTVFTHVRDRIDPFEVLDPLPLSELMKQIPKASNILIHFRGSQVLTQYQQGEKDSLFEAIEEEDFFIQKAISKRGWNIQAACRYSSFMPVLDYVSLEKHFVLHVSFGSTPLVSLEGLIEHAEIIQDHHCYAFNERELDRANEHPEPGDNLSYEVQGLNLDARELFQLASLMQYLSAATNTPDTCIDASMQSKYHRRFRFSLSSILISLLMLLLINFFVFDSLGQRKLELERSGQHTQASIRAIEELEQQIKEYQKLALPAGTSTQSHTLFLEDLALIRPNGVWFNELRINPLDSKPDSQKAISPLTQNINLKGEAKNPMVLNRFIESLKELEWVRNIDLVYYELPPGKSRADFEIDIIR